MGQLNKDWLSTWIQNGCLESSFNNNMISYFKNSHCNACSLSKSHVLPFPICYSRATESFEFIHTDAWGTAPTLSRLGYKYFHFHRWLFMLHMDLFFVSQSEVCDIFKWFHQMVKTQSEKQIKTIRSNSGGEYVSSDLCSFLSINGILHQKSCPYTP